MELSKENQEWFDKSRVMVSYRDSDGVFCELDVKEKLLEMQSKINELEDELLKSKKLVDRQQCCIDELMTEFCPDRMTQDQLANYEASQKVSDTDVKEIFPGTKAALNDLVGKDDE